jgi:hypothetical protein
MGAARQRAGLQLLLELHEDEIPDLDEAVAVLIGRAGRPAGDMLAMVIEDLGAGPARADIAHRQKLSEVGMRMILSVAQAGDLRPEPVRLVVGRE